MYAVEDYNEEDEDKDKDEDDIDEDDNNDEDGRLQYLEFLQTWGRVQVG